MDSISLIKRYFKYLVFAKTKYYLHSPFVYDFMVNVIQDDRKFYAFEEIAHLKKKLLKNNTIITVSEQGAGSRKMGNKRSIKQITKVAGATQQKGELLFRLINYFNCKNILELGTSVGLGTAYMAKASPNCKVVTVEACANTLKIAQQNIKALHLSNVKTINATFSNFLKEQEEKNNHFDLVYFDGDHKKESTISYFNQMLTLKNNNSIFVFDDINWSDDMYAAWQHIIANPQISLSIDLFQLGVIFFKKDQAKQHFKLYF